MTDSAFMALCEASVDARVAGSLDHALELAMKAIDERPEQASAWHTLAMAQAEMGLHRMALVSREKTVKLLEKTSFQAENSRWYQQCMFGYATSLLLNGEWQKAWQYWEIGRIGYSWSPAPGTAYWKGQRDGSLLVICEGGYGDLFLFSRFLRPLRDKFKGPIGLVVWKGCRDVLHWDSMGIDAVYEVNEQFPMAIWRYSVSIMSLPAFFNTLPSRESIPRPVKLPHQHMGPTGDSLRIGFCWRSEENQSKRRVRSLDVETANEISYGIADGVSLYSLCPPGKGLSVIDEFLQPGIMLFELDHMSTWIDTIKYLSSMDFIVTVDTAVAHLAGMLGLPALCLLPLNVDWKWGLTGDTSLWYEDDFRLFRNRDPLRWETDRIIEAIREMLP